MSFGNDYYARYFEIVEKEMFFQEKCEILIEKFSFIPPEFILIINLFYFFWIVYELHWKGSINSQNHLSQETFWELYRENGRKSRINLCLTEWRWKKIIFRKIFNQIHLALWLE